MNKDFEAVVMDTYAELCIMWRVAHVTRQAQAEDFDMKLKSLEAVVAAFDLNTPMDEAFAPAPPHPSQAVPQPRVQHSHQPQPTGAGLILED